MMKERELIAALKNLNNTYGEFSDAENRTNDVVRDLKPLIGKSEGKVASSRLVSIGVALIALPDPFIVTDITGSALVAVGLLRKKMKRPTVSDAVKEAQKLIKKFDYATQELNLITNLSLNNIFCSKYWGMKR
jgi:hypothetical protein